MGVLWKTRARKASAGGVVNVGYGNFTFPGLLTKQHVSLRIGDFDLRMNFDEAAEVATDILKYIAEHKHDAPHK